MMTSVDAGSSSASARSRSQRTNTSFTTRPTVPPASTSTSPWGASKPRERRLSITYRAWEPHPKITRPSGMSIGVIAQMLDVAADAFLERYLRFEAEFAASPSDAERAPKRHVLGSFAMLNRRSGNVRSNDVGQILE